MFVFEISLIESTMLEWGKDQSTYCLSMNPKIWLWYCWLRHTSNTRVVQASKFVDKIDLGGRVRFDKSHFSDFEPENKDSNNEPAIVNKISKNNLECIKQLCNICIVSKYTKIVRYKKMTLIIYKFQKIYTNWWKSHDLFLLSERPYISLFFDGFIQISWIFFFWSKDKFIGKLFSVD